MITVIENVPLVSISVITYNHVKYIRQCLDGILMQKVDFTYEVLVHDDASTDGTADIIREYVTKYPHIIKPIYQTENQYSQGKTIIKFNIDRSHGKYLAFCEGDDYWTDLEKLQRQVNFLETHPEYIGTAHRVRVINELGETIDIPGFSDVMEHVYTAEEYVKKRLPSQLSSLVVRNIFLTLNPNILKLFYSCKANGDERLSLLLVMMGDIYCFSEEASVYRRIVSEGASWNARMYGKNGSYNLFRQVLALQQFADEGFGFHLPPSDLYDILLGAFGKVLRNPSRSNLRILISIINEIPNKRSMIIYCQNKLPYHAKRIINSLVAKVS